MFPHIQSNNLFLSYCKRCCLNMYNVYSDAQCATVSPLSAEYSICSAEASVSAIQEKVANMQLYLLICWWCNMVALHLSVIVRGDKPAFLRLL